MNPVNSIRSSLPTTAASPSSGTIWNISEATLKAFEEAIDQIVAMRRKEAKAQQQANLQAAARAEEMRAEFQQKVAFLTSAVHQAEIALAALEGAQNQAGTTNGQSNSGQLESQKQDVLYWQSRLSQAGSPDGTANPL
jgi:hypothetical protein